jgi:mono/diheme cytochrome c family protein
VRAGFGDVATHCGSCHREDGHTGGAGLHLDLPAPMSASVMSSPPYRTAVGRGRILSADANASLLFQRFTEGGPGRMPPVGTQVMHDDGVARVRAMTEALPHPGRQSAY